MLSLTVVLCKKKSFKLTTFSDSNLSPSLLFLMVSTTLLNNFPDCLTIRVPCLLDFDLAMAPHPQISQLAKCHIPTLGSNDVHSY